MKKIYALLPVLLLSVNLYAQSSQPYFIGSCSNDMLNKVVLFNHQLYGIGTTESFGATEGDVYLFKADTLGHTLWARQVGTGSETDQGVLLGVNPAGHIITGSRVPHDLGSIMLAVFDTSGNFLQASVLNDPGFSFQEMNIKPDNGALFCGMQISGTHYLPAIFSTDASGNVLWSKTLSSLPASDTTGGNGIASGITALADGSCIVTGTIQAGTNSYPFAAKLDNSGNTVWQNTYDMNAMDGYGNVIQTNDGHFVFCGSALRTGGEGSDPYIIKTDDSGNPVYSFVYPLDQGGTPLTSLARVRVQAHHDHLVLTGTVASDMTGTESNFYTLYLDENAEVVWSKKYGNGTTNICQSAVVTGSMLLLGGYSAENETGNAVVGQVQTDVLLLGNSFNGDSPFNTESLVTGRNTFVTGIQPNPLTTADYPYATSAISPLVNNVQGTYDSAACFGLGNTEMLADISRPGLYPNPASVYTEVWINGNTEMFDLTVHHTSGRLVQSQSSIRGNRATIALDGFEPGVYIVTLRTGSRSLGSQKLVVH